MSDISPTDPVTLASPATVLATDGLTAHEKLELLGRMRLVAGLPAVSDGVLGYSPADVDTAIEAVRQRAIHADEEEVA